MAAANRQQGNGPTPGHGAAAGLRRARPAWGLPPACRPGSGCRRAGPTPRGEAAELRSPGRPAPRRPAHRPGQTPRTSRMRRSSMGGAIGRAIRKP